MRVIIIIASLLFCANAWPSAATGVAAVAPHAQASDPLSPCDLLTVQQVAEIAGVSVIEARRRVDIREDVAARREGRAPAPGIICSYETRADFGAIQVVLPPAVQRTVAAYRANRDANLRKLPAVVRPVPGLGEDAWMSSGIALHVLVRDGLTFRISLQHPTDMAASRELLMRLARAALARL